ncbi:hypothetical protein [Corynebacterium pacaense]|uniref:hypothetical protein n=1 Tax=Corynebacterium pacaense TaxID=1816684 RepID=UPI0009BAD34B|nr:hypothetical protein [Corynebacterium pacaense]
MSFSKEELAAMKQRAAELRKEEAGGTGTAKKEREAKQCVEAIEALEGNDKQIAELLHRVVAEEAPQLDPKTWYGFPSYAREGKVIVFFQPASKFDTRYGSIAFNEGALLDDGEFWPTAYAVLAVSDKFEAKLRGLVRIAAG